MLSSEVYIRTCTLRRLVRAKSDKRTHISFVTCATTKCSCQSIRIRRSCTIWTENKRKSSEKKLRFPTSCIQYSSLCTVAVTVAYCLLLRAAFLCGTRATTNALFISFVIRDTELKFHDFLYFFYETPATTFLQVHIQYSLERNYILLLNDYVFCERFYNFISAFQLDHVK